MIVGILGGGQLGRMLALAGIPLGLRFRFFDPSPDAPAGEVGELTVGSFDDPGAIDRFAHGADVITFEFENVPASALRRAEAAVPVRPSPGALEACQDRALEKALFARVGLDAPEFARIDAIGDVEAAVASVGLPAVLKTRRFGYDGKGQRVVRTAGEARAAAAALLPHSLILERFVPFEREVSMIAVRGGDGTTACYPLVQNVHGEGILRESIAPAPGPGSLEAAARTATTRILDDLGYIGVLAVEFHVEPGPSGPRLLANEVAPRVHNSGHWTIEGAATSQFENHLRAILGLPLGPCGAIGFAGMVNLIGRTPPLAAMLAIPGVRPHLYAKAPRPGRKLGHATIVAKEEWERAEGLARLRALM